MSETAIATVKLDNVIVVSKYYTTIAGRCARTTPLSCLNLSQIQKKKKKKEKKTYIQMSPDDEPIRLDVEFRQTDC